MNNMKIKQAQQKSLRRAKAEVARLNDELNNARFWHDLAEVGIVAPIEEVKPIAYKRVKYAIIAISIAVIVMIVCCGCIENTMRGAGNAVQGIGKLVTGVGTDVVRGVDGYSQEN